MISIVIPALNEEKLLPDCLKSLQSQDYQGEYEVIVADNGSTDSTASIAREFGARLVPCPEKKGVTHARQLGANAARGEIIIQADADTVYPADWLRKIAGHFSAHPEAAAVAGRFLYVSPPWWAQVEYLFRNYANWLTSVLFGLPLFVSGATFAFRRQAFRAVGGYRGLTYATDQYGIAGRLRKIGAIIYDSNVYVLTSPRRVKKPLILIVRDIIVNISHWGAYILSSRINALGPSFIWLRPKRVHYPLLLIGLLVTSLVTYGYFVPASPVFGKVYAKVTKPPEKVVALTFDDGPNEPYTSQILDILAQYNIKATFFVIGKNVELYPDTSRCILADGHVVGNHSQNHDANHALSDYGARDMQLAQTTISNVLGVQPHLYRPPHGKKSPWEIQQAKKMGMIEVTWSASIFNETAASSAARIAWKLVNEIDPGEIILLHDGYGTQHDSANADRSFILEALPLIIEQLQAKGYIFVTIPELLSVPAYNN